MRQALALSSAAITLFTSGAVVGHKEAEACPPGYTRGVTSVHRDGPHATVPPNLALGQHTMMSVCTKSVTLPVLRLRVALVAAPSPACTSPDASGRVIQPQPTRDSGIQRRIPIHAARHTQ